MSSIKSFVGIRENLPLLDRGGHGWCWDTCQFFIGDGTSNHEVGVDGGGHSVSDAPYDTSWIGVTNIAPSKNAVRNLVETLVTSKIESHIDLISAVSPVTI